MKYKLTIVAFSFCFFVYEVGAQPTYWQFSYDELIPGVVMGGMQKETISIIAKKRRQFGQYQLLDERRFVDTQINYVNAVTLSGNYNLPTYHKLTEWFDKESMAVTYNILFVNGVCVRASLYFIYPNYDMGAIDINYQDLVSFFSQVGWYPFCAYGLWENGNILCGYQSNFLPTFEAYYGQEKDNRMYRHRLKISKGLCADKQGTISEAIEITFSDAEALNGVLKINNMEKAAFYGNSHFQFGLDKMLAGCTHSQTN